jgi:hypothetical protein
VNVYSLDMDEAREIRDQALASLSVLGLEGIKSSSYMNRRLVFTAPRSRHL